MKRGDVWWNYAQTALQIVYWLNPLLWFVFSRIKSDRELACDALALSHTPGAEVQSYGETIIKLLERIQRPVALPGLVGISENKAQLKQRILMVAGFGKRRTSIWLPACLLVIVMLLGLSEAKGVGEKPAVPAVPKSTKVAAVAADAKPVEAVKPVKAVDPVPVAKPTPIVAPVQAAEPKSPATPVIPASKEVQIDPSTGIPVQVPASPVESDVQIDPNTGQPIKWPPGVPHEKLVTRFFKVDPNTFIQALNAFDGKSDKKLSDSDFDQPEILNRIRDVFAQAGAKLEATNTSKSLFYQRNKGVLLARATLPELAIIQGVLDVFNVAPPQVVLTAKIVEMVSDTRTLTNSEFLLSDANMPQGILSEEGKVAMIGTPLPAGFPTNARAVVVRAILNDASFHNLLQSLRGREGVNMLSTPNVTTLSGRQARISVLNDPTPVEARAGLPATGQIFDILPTVKPDGYTIHLQVGFTLVEKLPPAKTGFFSKSSKLPTIQRRELSTTATVRDGETIILTGLQTKEGKKTKSFAIFITPTIIDPAGNRIHSPAKLPFNPNVVPP